MKSFVSTIILLTLVTFVACKNGAQKEISHKDKSDSITVITDGQYAELDSTIKNKVIIYDEGDRLIYLAIESNQVSCYTQQGNDSPKKVIFGHVYGNDGFPIMYSYRYGDNLFLVGDFIPNSNGWTVRFPVYKLDAKTLNMSFAADGAAINFGKDGFKIAQCRLTNPDADCTANEVWVMHNSYYDTNGNKIREDKSEYDFRAMEKEYGDSLVNAPRTSI